jgi:hypothetical protein
VRTLAGCSDAAGRHQPSSQSGRLNTMSKRTLALVGLIALGAWLRTWQYAEDTSLWIDEVALVFGIVHSDLTFRPHCAAAP